MALLVLAPRANSMGRQVSLHLTVAASWIFFFFSDRVVAVGKAVPDTAPDDQTAFFPQGRARLRPRSYRPPPLPG